MRLRLFIPSLVVLIASNSATTQAQSTLTATRATTPPRIDGRSDDPVWRLAEPRGDFRMFSPREGDAPVFRTELQVAYDDRALFVLVRAFDPRPDSVVRLLSRRDTHGAPNDEIQLFLDSFYDRRSGYEYIVNAAGVKSDYLLFDDTGFDASWDGVWDVATQVDTLGWVAEFAIPLAQLRFSDRTAPRFGLMVWRLVGRTGERSSWPAYRPARPGYVSQAGTLVGVRDLVRPGSLEVSPYVRLLAGSASSTAVGATIRTEASAGGDLRYVPRPNASIDATFNPDFGQVESDPAVLDLSGFEVFQAERRPFFLEGAGQLSFPLANDGSAALLHSRRIGRAPILRSAPSGEGSPTETTILGAAKVTARPGPGTSLVALSALTSAEYGAARPDGERAVVEPRARYTVARVQRDLRAGRSGVGLMVTDVSRDAGDSAASATVPTAARAAALVTQHQSADGSYRVSGWLGGSEVRGNPAAIAALQLSPVHGFQQPDDGVTFDPARTAVRGAAGQLFVGKVGGGVTRVDASYRWISPGFDVNELGFLTRSGVRSVSANTGVRATRAGRLGAVRYRTASLGLGFAGDWSSAGLPMARGLSLTGAMQLDNLVQLQGTFSQQLSGAFCTMICTRGGAALVDEPRRGASVDVTGDPRHPLIPHVSGEWFRDDQGRSRGFTAQADVLWRARSNLELSIAGRSADAVLDAFFLQRLGSPFVDTSRVVVARLDQPVRSLTARVDYTLTTALSVQWYAQAYVSRGMYTHPRVIVAPRDSRYEDRFRPFDDAPADLGVDFRQFRSNTVLRWEYRPGSTLFVVWSQGRDVDGSEPARLRFLPDLRGLFREPPANRLAVKVSHWLAR